MKVGTKSRFAGLTGRHPDACGRRQQMQEKKDCLPGVLSINLLVPQLRRRVWFTRPFRRFWYVSAWQLWSNRLANCHFRREWYIHVYNYSVSCILHKEQQRWSIDRPTRIRATLAQCKRRSTLNDRKGLVASTCTIIICTAKWTFELKTIKGWHFTRHVGLIRWFDQRHPATEWHSCIHSRAEKGFEQ